MKIVAWSGTSDMQIPHGEQREISVTIKADGESDLRVAYLVALGWEDLILPKLRENDDIVNEITVKALEKARRSERFEAEAVELRAVVAEQAQVIAHLRERLEESS